MDYSMAALKLLCGQLKDARQSPSQKAATLGGILFQRVWVQGVLVSACSDGRILLDDGTGVIDLVLYGDFRERQWRVGMYVMVVGGYVIKTGQPPVIKVHKLVDLTAFPDREAMWYLEVMEVYNMFYKPLVEEEEQ